MSSILNQTYAYAFKNMIPLITTIEITHQCNFFCQHCYNIDRQDKNLKHQILDKESILRSLDQLAELGTLYVNFTGGEPITHPDLLELIEYTRFKLNMEPRLKTNGSLINESNFKDMYQAGLRSLDISLYGASEQAYEKFTGNKKNLELTKNAMRIVSENELYCSISIIVHRYNYQELDQMIELCQSFNIPYAVSYDINERYDHTTGARRMEITTEEFIELLNGPHKLHFDFDNPEKSKQCSCARSICGIGVNGDVYPCIGAPVYSGNIHEDSLINIWKNSPQLNKIRSLKNKDFEECNKCEYITKCMRSSGSIYANTRNYTGCDPATYKQAKIRFENDK